MPITTIFFPLKTRPCINFILLLIALLLTSTFCVQAQKQDADLLVFNTTVYTVNDQFTKAEAFVIKDGRFLAVGQLSDLLEKYKSKKMLDAKGKPIYPGFIDGHAHFVGYAESLQRANLVGTKSWESILKKMKTFALTHPDGWLRGEGWDQNDWSKQAFPTKRELDLLFPNRPVLLTRIDGHAVIINQKAMDLAGITGKETVSGGKILMEEGKPTGVLVDNAIDLVQNKIPPTAAPVLAKALDQAQKNCFAVGLTSLDDCGLDYEVAMLVDSLQKANYLKMRMYILLSDSSKNYDFLFGRGIIKTPYLSIRGFKVYADGALGSRGACLLEPYQDDVHNHGFLLSSIAHYKSVADKLANSDFQMCTHAIGDSGNRVLLETYAGVLKGKNDRRWRIEHAQVVNKEDIHFFGDYNIIPSVQPTHATSDMYWAGKRLGESRLKTAYAYKDELNQNGWLSLGTDFPVEDINPMYTFYAAVVRKDHKGFPANGFQMENALNREEALRGMTIWAAKANFEEKEKGSIEVGKYADFVIMDNDLMTSAPEKLWQLKPIATYIAGEKVFEK